MPLIRHLVLVSCLLALLAALPSARAASMAIDSLAGPVTQNEINSFKLYMATQIPPVTPWGALNGTNNDHNHWADGDGGNDLEAFGLMYEISGDVTILTNMIGWADYCVSQRNDLMSPTNGGQRVMWTGNIDKVWCPNEPTTAGAAYAGGENGDTKAHLALCALEILNTPSLWNTTVPDGNPYGYGVTYFQRATNYIEKCDEGNLEYDLKYFLTNNLIRNPTNWPTGYHTMEANNIQMMLDGSWERLAQCHEILGDNPALLARYDAAVNGSGNECLTGMEHAYLTNGIPVYKWYYYPPTAPQAAGDNPIENVGHAAYDMVGMSRAFMRGLNGEGNPYGFPRAGMIPFANALAYVMNRATNIFAGEVDGTGSTQNYMQAQWLLPADWNPVVYDIVATADYASGRYKTTTLMEATMLWMKNRRYQGFSVTPVVVTKTVAAGAGASFPVTVAPLGGFSNTVSLALSGLPPGANASFNFSNLNIGIIPSAATNSTLAITTSNSTPPGTYPLTIMGTGGGLTHNASVTLVVGTYSMVVSPASQTVPPGGSTAFTMTVATNSGFSSSVNFGLAGLPANVNAGFSPASLSGAGTSTLNVTTATNAPAGNYTLTFYGTNGTAVSSATAILNITVTTLITNSGALVWTNGAGNLNWSGPLNWTNLTAGGNGPPGPGNSVIFTNYSAANASALTSPGSGVVIPANINSAVNTSFTIAGLTNFANSLNTSPLFQNLGVANGATLATGGIQIGGFAQYDFGLNNVVNTTISGAGATLLVTNGAVIVSQGSNTGGGGAHDASLDLSGLDTFVMNGTQLKLGVENITRAGGVLYLAKTNLLTLTDAGYANSDGSGSPFGGNPALYLGHNKSAFGNGAQLYLGISNSIAVDYVSIGRGDTNGLLKFNPAFLASNPSATISGLGGAGSRVGVYIVGDGSSGQGGSFVASNDFSGGTVNALVNYLCVGRGRQGASDTTTNAGVLTLTAGDINAGLLTLGCLYPSGSNSAVLGTVNVNGGTLTVITNLTLATRPQPGGAGSAQATLNVNGGTVQATNITGGGGLSTINLASGTIDLSGGGPFAGSLVNVSGLNLGAAGVLATALLENAATISISNVITIAPNGTLAGNPVITAPGLIVNGILSPGVNGIGAITNNGPVTLGAGGDFFVSVQNADGAPVTGWDFLQVNGGLNVQSSNTGPFTVQVQSFDPAGSGQVTNFSADTSYAWPVAAAAGGITNFNATKIIADGSLFQNDLAGGYFYVGTNNNSLVLSFTNNHPPAAGTVTLYRTGATMAIPLATLAAHWSDPDGDPVVLTSVDSSTNGAGLGTDGAYIYYTNANVVADAIFYTVQDVRTNPPAVYRPGDTQRTAAGEIILLPPPAIGGVSFTGANLLFRVANGVPGGTNYVLSSTNLALPLNQWTITATNTFDAGGGGNFTNSLDPNAPQTYYLLRLQ
jgi:hypothetical protein